jgi:hypothetical protein
VDCPQSEGDGAERGASPGESYTHEVEAEEGEESGAYRSQRQREEGKRRQFLKEIVVSHPIWQEGRFWEQALWQCVLEQVSTKRLLPPFLCPHVSYSCK